MKRTLIAAATLLLGTSALAGAAAQEKNAKPVLLTSHAKTSAPAGDKVLAAKSVQAAALKKDMTYSGMGGPLENEGSVSVADKAEMMNKPMASNSTMLAKNEKIVGMKTAKASTGVGGPFEEGLAGTAGLATRPAAEYYPPCRPGPDDDRCIQLYEPGVSAELASWDRRMGALAGNSAKTAMGGPYEAAEASWKDEAHEVAGGKASAMGPYESVEAMTGASALAMNGDGALDSGLSESSDPADQSELAGHSEFAGVGGPIESQSGYPPCSPGAGDDSCIQLYEPGVTGAGN